MDWQQACALLIVALAFAWLVWTRVLRRGARAGCGGCDGCAAPSPPPSTLIPADELEVLKPEGSRKHGG